MMVDFAWMWQPWGGAPDDDILVRFGLPEQAFYKRLANILTRGRAHLTPHRARSLGELCEQKLAASPPVSTC
jgi:hypothetical protein